MSETPEATGMTAPELSALVASAVKDAMAPLAKSTGDIQGLLQKASDEVKPEPVNLGQHPIGRRIRALGMASLAKHPGDVECAIYEVKKNWPASQAEPSLKWLEGVKKGLSVGNASQAGDMIMPQDDPEWIELLRPKTVVRNIASTIPMPKGATSRRKQVDSATAYYGGENDKMTESKLKVGRANLSYKKLTALSVVSNDLIRFGGPESDRKVQEDLLRVIALREDRAFLVGNPPTDAGSPTGIRYQTAAANVFASAGTSLANFQADLTKAVRLVEETDVDTASGRFIMSPALYWTIYALATTTGDWVFAQQLASGNLLGFPIVKSSQLKESRLASWAGAASGSSGLLFFVAGSALEIHDSYQRSVAIWPGGAYYDATAGVVASGISQDETVITCIAEHDFLQTYDTAAAIVTGYAV